MSNCSVTYSVFRDYRNVVTTHGFPVSLVYIKQLVFKKGKVRPDVRTHPKLPAPSFGCLSPAKSLFFFAESDET